MSNNEDFKEIGKNFSKIFDSFNEKMSEWSKSLGESLSEAIKSYEYRISETILKPLVSFFAQLPESTKEALTILGKYGWYFDEEMDLVWLKHVASSNSDNEVVNLNEIFVGFSGLGRMKSRKP